MTHSTNVILINFVKIDVIVARYVFPIVFFINTKILNEIAQSAMKSEQVRTKSANADEIKSVLLPTKLDFITK